MATKWDNMRGYGVGYDGTMPGIGGCPFNMNQLQEAYVNGTKTPTRVINFKDLTTDCSIPIEPTTVGEQTIDLLASSCYFETPTLNLRNPNLHRSGATMASDFWGVISDNVVVPKLIKKLHEGGIDNISVYTLAYIDNQSGITKPKIVQQTEFTSCFMKFVDHMSYGHLTVFAFAYTKVKITQRNVSQLSEKGTNKSDGAQGNYVYEFDFNNSLGGAGS